jgi:DNA-binding transcriptional LysR family regulator
MTIHHLQVFLEVYRTQNITEASEKLHITQPTVTRTVQEIERYYGVRLFDRINCRIYRTEGSEQFYAQALHIVELFDSMEKEMKNWDEFGALRVGSTITLGNVMLPEIVSEFMKRHPGFHLKVRISNGADLQQALINNHLDIALIEGGVTEEQLLKEAFHEDRLVLILPPGSPLMKKKNLKLEDLADEKFIMRETGSMGRSFVDDTFRFHEMAMNPIWESASTQAIIRAVHAGLGISFLPEKLIGEAAEKGDIETRTVRNAPMERKNYLVWHKNKFLTKAAKEFMQISRGIAEKEQDPV